ncbi:MAG TPA: efflux RND transporter periplasmic adaptor subunit [Isosphaeraceae bacterium]|nr:efflux RND transporter periplasmic adaptor subunit [Isosphaeraceae bacterium]
MDALKCGSPPLRHAPVLLLLGLAAGCEPNNAYVPPPPPVVTVSTPERRPVTTYLEHTGTTQAIETVDLRARVRGFLESIHFTPGAIVKQGALLFVIDPKPFRAKVDQAAADLESKEAQLVSAESEFKRSSQLYQRKVISDEEMIKTRANRDAAKAAVEAANAALEQSKLDLGYTEIGAPISGRIGRNLVDVGNLVGDGQATLLATIVKDDPIYAYMNVSEAHLLMYRKMVREGKRVDYRAKPIRLDLGLANEEGFPHEGRLDYADPAIDPDTGTITARGVFPNPDGAMIPGLFARIRVPLEEDRDALLVDERALGADQAGPFVLVVDEKKGNEVERRPVKLGAKVGGMRVIEQNLGPNDLVIVNGLQRARPGAKVDPKRQGSTSVAVASGPSAGAEEVPAPPPMSKPAEVVKMRVEAARPAR